jgi:hypothetical protein
MKSWMLSLYLFFLPALVWAGNVAPLGLEVGVVDLATVKAKLSGQTRLRDAGTNKWTGGPMLRSDGDGLEVEGLQGILFIFGQDQKLDGVVMTLGKDRLKEVLAALRKKYKTVRENIPFVGDTSATYRQGDSLVRVEAPHLSFSMEVLYLSQRLNEAFNKGSSAEEAERRRRQAEKF